MKDVTVWWEGKNNQTIGENSRGETGISKKEQGKRI